MGRLAGRLFVGFTLFLITFIGYSSQIFIIWPWYGRELSIELLSLLLPFNALLCMLLWNYYLCVVTDPGQVPKIWKPDFAAEDGYEVKKLTRGPRYCRTCENYKPPRAHHCRQCKRCVLRMDHHCPWVNNCVGHFNYGHFIRFLFFVDLSCSYHLTMITKRVLAATGARFWDEPSGVQLIFIVLNYTFSIPVLLAVGGFSIYHFYALLGNMTTIEGWEKDKVATLVRRGKVQEIKFPYNLGTRRNIAAVLGNSPLLWCWPTVPPGTGLKYPLANPQDSGAESWPPKDPNPYPNHVFTLPQSPWTYENGSFNPELKPSNKLHAQSSTTRRRKSQPKDVSSVPPYHPDYKPPGDNEAFSDTAPSVDEEDEVEEYILRPQNNPKRLVRRGSEGYEVGTIDREQMLREHVESQVHEPGRYRLYAPDPVTPSESESEVEDEREEEPLVSKVEHWRAESSVE